MVLIKCLDALVSGVIFASFQKYQLLTDSLIHIRQTKKCSI